MAGDASFPVEDFVEAIALQLDRVQDALAIKAEVRPLTYALKDFALQLHVFVEMDDQGQIRFRNSGPNEAGSSVVSMDFTTITTPMIKENTISLAQARGPTLNEAGLSPLEQLRLARLGVRNLNQLQRLGIIAGPRNLARLAGLPVDRIQQAVWQGRPQVIDVQPQPLPAPANGQVRPPPFQVGPLEPPPVAVHPAPAVPGLRIQGKNLLDGGPPEVRLNGQPLTIAQADDEGLTVHLPLDTRGGQLEIELPGGETLAYELSVPEVPQ